MATMIDQAMNAAIEQNIAMMGEYFPKVCFVLFRGFVDAGFTESQAFELIRSYVAGVATVKPT